MWHNPVTVSPSISVNWTNAYPFLWVNAFLCGSELGVWAFMVKDAPKRPLGRSLPLVYRNTSVSLCASFEGSSWLRMKKTTPPKKNTTLFWPLDFTRQPKESLAWTWQCKHHTHLKKQNSPCMKTLLFWPVEALLWVSHPVGPSKGS